LAGRAYIAGAFEHPGRHLPDVSPAQLHADVALGAQAFLPEAIAPVVAYLAHEDCVLSGEVLSAYGGHVGRVFVGETKGITMAGLSVEDVEAKIEHVIDTTHFEVPTDPNAALLVGR
jgi:hypothetical protein